MTVAVLFARRDSNYKSMPVCDVWDEDRNATNYRGGHPVIAHPPCRAWGRLRGFANPAPGEKALALFAVDMVRQCGGVIEHPAWSSLWAAAGLPLPGEGVDQSGGWTLPVNQMWWGHRAEKPTWFYIVGVRPAKLPVLPITLGEATHVCGGTRKRGALARPEISKAEREHTPPELCRWLVELAQLCDMASQRRAA